MSKKTEVMRTTKEESRIITLLREIDLDDLIHDIDSAIHSSPSTLASLQLMRSVLKSEFIPPLETLDSRTLTPEYKSILTKAFENKTPIILVGSLNSNKLTLTKSILNFYKYLLKTVALIDNDKSLTNSACLVGTRLLNITQEYGDFNVLYNLNLENIDRLIINNPRFLNDYLLLHLASNFGLPYLWISDTHPLESEMLKTSQRAYNLVKDNLESSEHLVITCLSGDSKYNIEMELVQPLNKQGETVQQ